MRCPFCKKADSRVIDSRAADDGNTIRRRRECTGCGKRFTTYEVVEKIPLMVIKNDGRRVVFDRNKLLNGLIRSCDGANCGVIPIGLIKDVVKSYIHFGELIDIPVSR